jgi:cell division protein FtsB
MARADKRFRHGFYTALAGKVGNDIERMNPVTRKAYLEWRLRLIEAQIRILAERVGVSEEDLAAERVWLAKPLDDDRWASLVSLDYLIAARDALIETIETLGQGEALARANRRLTI